MIVVRLLGPIEVVDSSGAVHSPGSALRRTLLALLAMRAGEVLATDWLLEHAWGGEPPESGSAALRFHISRLRDELGDSALIETRPGGYRLAVTPDEVDALAIEPMARSARLENDRVLAAGMYADVLAMWSGTPFVDAAPCSALDDEAVHLSELLVSVTEEHLHARLDTGAGREIIADLSRATTQHPLRESLWALLITAQYRAGHQADALRSYEHMRLMLAETLGLNPSSELQHLQRRILQHDPSLLGEADLRSPDTSTSMLQRARQTLPSPVTALIDSHDRLGHARTLLRDHRLVTLTGPGGVGKTRLAVELGWSSLEQFDARVLLVELAPVANADSVIGAVASTLSIQPQHGMTHLEAIVDWLSGRELLLILDNCEHVLEPVRQLLTMVLARCPTVRVIATSREPLGIAGERVHPVKVMNSSDDGVALFLDRAAAADSTFVLGEGEHETVTDICRRLDGLPLAIELAAARVRSMAPVDLLARLDDRFRLLRRAPREGFDHHHALEAAMEWSYRLLGVEERTVFDRLSVFTGDFHLGGAEAICADGNIDEAVVVDILSSLVDKSMVVAERRTEGARYRLLDTLRRFGERQLDAGGTTGMVRDRHMHHYLDTAEEADTLFRTARQAAGSEMFECEWDNLRGAHKWAVLTGDLRAAERLVAASFQDAAYHSRFEHSEWVDQTITLGTSDPPSPHTMALAAFWAYAVEDKARGDELLARGIDLADSIDDPITTMCVMLADRNRFQHPRLPDPFRQLERLASKLDLDREWWVLIERADRALRDHPASRAMHVDRLVETAERVRAPSLLIEAALALGHRSVMQRPPDFANAMRLYTQALDISRPSGDLNGDALRAVALAAVGLGSHAAIGSCREALVKLSATRYWFRVWHLMESIGLSLASTGQTEAASVVIGNLEAHHPPFGIEHELGFRIRTLDIIRHDPLAEEWMARGAAMDRFHIVDYTLAALGRFSEERQGS